MGLCPKLWVGGSKVPNFLVKITIQLFLLQTSRNVLKHVIHKWGGHIWPFHDALRPQRWNFVRKNSIFFQKKIALNSLKSKINLTFIFHLVESQTCAVGRWGPMFGTKSQINTFFLTPSLIHTSIGVRFIYIKENYLLHILKAVQLRLRSQLKNNFLINFYVDQ